MTLTIPECGAAWADAERLRGDSEGKRWEVAPTALEVYGTSGTARLAAVLDGSVDTVSNLAKAQRLYLYLCSWDEQKANLARAIYGYLRFAEVWQKHSRYEFSPAECLEYLMAKLGNDALGAEIENHHNPQPEWKRRIVDAKFVRKIERIATEPDPDQPIAITRAARFLAARIERLK